MPTVHRETLTDMDADLVADTFRSARRVAAAVEAAFDPVGLDLLQADGEAVGQEGFPAHVLVIPRYADDGVTVEWPRGELTDCRGSEVAAAVREGL